MNDAVYDQLGLNTREIAVYRAVIKEGVLTPVVLARAVNLNRTTAYSIARGLVEKGLLVEDIQKRPRTFAPASPTDVVALIGDEQKKLKEKEKAFKTIAEELSQLADRSQYSVPTLRFIEERKIEKFLRQQTPTWDKNILASKETTWWGFQDHTFVEHYDDWITWYWAQSPQPIDLKLLSNRAEAEVKLGPKLASRRYIKYWGEANLFRSTLWAIGNYVVMINTRSHPFYLVEIHDELMANDQREVFKNLWPLV